MAGAARPEGDGAAHGDAAPASYDDAAPSHLDGGIGEDAVDGAPFEDAASPGELPGQRLVWSDELDRPAGR